MVLQFRDVIALQNTTNQPADRVQCQVFHPRLIISIQQMKYNSDQPIVTHRSKHNETIRWKRLAQVIKHREKCYLWISALICDKDGRKRNLLDMRKWSFIYISGTLKQPEQTKLTVVYFSDQLPSFPLWHKQILLNASNFCAAFQEVVRRMWIGWSGPKFNKKKMFPTA